MIQCWVMRGSLTCDVTVAGSIGRKWQMRRHNAGGDAASDVSKGYAGSGGQIGRRCNSQPASTHAQPARARDTAPASKRAQERQPEGTRNRSRDIRAFSVFGFVRYICGAAGNPTCHVGAHNVCATQQRTLISQFVLASEACRKPSLIACSSHSVITHSPTGNVEVFLITRRCLNVCGSLEHSYKKLKPLHRHTLTVSQFQWDSAHAYSSLCREEN